MLNQYSDKYLIPLNRSNVKPQAFVYYNTHNRPGAESEAENLTSAIEYGGCVSRSVKWESVNGLRKAINGDVTSVKTSCSLLIICLMSHGSLGCLHGSDDEIITIDTILKDICEELPPDIPLVGLCFINFNQANTIPPELKYLCSQTKGLTSFSRGSIVMEE